MLNAYQKIIDNLKDKDKFIILIDGYAGSGKTTLSKILSEELNATLIHVDDFYLPIEKRNSDWFETPAGNIDFSRLNDEVIIPFKKKETLIINKFNPRKQELEHLGKLNYNPKLIIEGSYSMHPEIKLDGTYKIFMKCNDIKQKERLIVREKDNYINFKNTWIVKELNYHQTFNIEKKSDQVIDTSDLF